MLNVEQLGKVQWGWVGERQGYIGGLGKIYKAHPITDPEFIPIATHCREVAIAKSNPENLQFNFIKNGKTLVQKGVLTQEELDYIYTQFELDPNTFVLPPHLQKT